MDAEPRPGETRAATLVAGGTTVVRNGAASSADVISTRRVSTETAPLDARVVTSHTDAVDGVSPAAASAAAGGAATDANAPARAEGAATTSDAATAETNLATSGVPATGTTQTAGASAAGTAATNGGAPGEAGQRREPALSPVEPEPQSPATTVSNLPPVVVDRRLDCIIELEPGEVVPGDRIIPLAIRFRRAGSKPVYVEGRDQDGHWGTLRPGNQYGKLRAAVQLANRSGPLNELEFSEFVGGVHRLADALDAAAEFPDMTEVVQMARELDGFAAQCDAQLSVNVLSDNAPWSGSYVQAVASQDGLLLSRDGTRFVKLDAQQNPVFTLTFEGTNFLRDDLTYKGGHMITLLLDVPVADEDILPWRLMCDYARSLAQRIGARVVDDQRRVLPDASLQAIDERLMTLYARLETASIPAGSPAARRLFSS
ncbi:MAG: cell division protein ZipA C-terminal FtsZ-binding domain-containing protein [Janthinobacterium lividum]